MKIAALNQDIIWKDPKTNFALIDKQLTEVQADLFLLPEMFTTGFCMEPEKIADQHEETLLWMKSFAAQKKVAIAGSVAVAEEGHYYNRFYFVKPDGNHQYYDKRHLFSYSGEDRVYTSGKKRMIVSYNGWKILLQVCYDLRFPVFSRNNADYDAILYVANWPNSRIDAWQTLLKARAIENQCYVFGVNRIGSDDNHLQYPESTYCFFADGSVVSTTKGVIVSAELNAEKLLNFRTKFSFLNDRDCFEITD